jgi:hypothetical protein
MSRYADMLIGAGLVVTIGCLTLIATTLLQATYSNRGWYLMRPPLPSPPWPSSDSDYLKNLVTGVHRPLNQWVQENEFDTAEGCHQEHTRRVSSITQTLQDCVALFKGNHDGHDCDEWREDQWLINFQRCVPSDDPRLRLAQ